MIAAYQARDGSPDLQQTLPEAAVRVDIAAIGPDQLYQPIAGDTLSSVNRKIRYNRPRMAPTQLTRAVLGVAQQEAAVAI